MTSARALIAQLLRRPGRAAPDTRTWPSRTAEQQALDRATGWTAGQAKDRGFGQR